MQAAIDIRRLAPLPQLTSIPSPPSELFIRGELPPRPLVAIVGTRRPTGYGTRVAGGLAARLATAGISVVSGLAFGIDVTAHRAALEAGGRTVAILPSGLDPGSITPQTNLRESDLIAASGALLSEYRSGTAVSRGAYHARNRLIAGLADRVVVIEAAIPSGTLITAQHAIDQGRAVWALPGPIDSPVSAGPNRLIDQGAHPLVAIDQFLESMGAANQSVGSDGLLGRLIKPRHADELAALTGRPAADLQAELTKLELRGLIRGLGGGFYVRS